MNEPGFTTDEIDGLRFRLFSQERPHDTEDALDQLEAISLELDEVALAGLELWTDVLRHHDAELAGEAYQRLVTGRVPLQLFELLEASYRDGARS